MGGRYKAVLAGLKTCTKAWLLEKIAARRLGRDRPYDQRSVRSILVLRFDRIGDMVVTTPFFEAIKRAFPNGKLAVLCSWINEPVIRENPHISDRPIYQGNLKGLFELLRLRRRYDLIVDLNHSVIWHDMLLIRLLAPIWAASVYKAGRYGVSGNSLPLYRLMPHADCSPNSRIARKYLQLAEYLGAGPTQKFSYELFSRTEVDTKIVSRIGLSAGDRYWVINQHGGRIQMSLQDVDMRQIIQMLLDSNPQRKVAWVSSPTTHAEVRQKCAAWFPGQDRILTPEPTTDVMQTASILRFSCGLVSPDTSLIHIAAAYLIPTVAVFSNERELYVQWRPPEDVWHRHLFSGDPKSLKGYDSIDLIRAVEELVTEIR
jgi:ADP-heptose:LPS heptosyltransferase